MFVACEVLNANHRLVVAIHRGAGDVVSTVPWGGSGFVEWFLSCSSVQVHPGRWTTHTCFVCLSYWLGAKTPPFFFRVFMEGKHKLRIGLEQPCRGMSLCLCVGGYPGYLFSHLVKSVSQLIIQSLTWSVSEFDSQAVIRFVSAQAS